MMGQLKRAEEAISRAIKQARLGLEILLDSESIFTG
jgi:hypothetical protein